MRRLLVMLTVVLVVVHEPGAARTLGRCEITRELLRQKVSRSLLSNWICLVEHASGGNTSIREGPLKDGTYNLGMFKINSKWCRDDYVGGECKLRCEVLTDDSIADDIRCALKIYNSRGFSGWQDWTDGCKGKTLPNVAECLKLKFQP